MNHATAHRELTFLSVWVTCLGLVATAPAGETILADWNTTTTSNLGIDWTTDAGTTLSIVGAEEFTQPVPFEGEGLLKVVNPSGWQAEPNSPWIFLAGGGGAGLASAVGAGTELRFEAFTPQDFAWREIAVVFLGGVGDGPQILPWTQYQYAFTAEAEGLNEFSVDLTQEIESEGEMRAINDIVTQLSEPGNWFNLYLIPFGQENLDLGDTTTYLDNLRVITPDGVAGDYNGDGAIDAADYTVWRDTLDSTSDLRADGNGNSVIDAGDYDVWRTNYGAGGGLSAAAAAPEPAGLALAAGLLSAGLVGRRLRK